jgi:hypothetical protein
MILRPRIEFKPVKRNALLANRYLRHAGTHLGIEPIAVHAEVER